MRRRFDRVPDAVRHSKAMRSIADHAAPQSRDRSKGSASLRPRLCSAHRSAKSHSASKTRVNALMALRCVRGTRSVCNCIEERDEFQTIDAKEVFTRK